MSVEEKHVDHRECHDDRGDHHGLGPRFCVNTEGNEHPWTRSTITFEEIAHLGGWPAAQGVIQINEDNTERPLAPGEVIHLRPGQAFCRRIRWKRGFTRAERITAEVDLMRRVFPNLEFREGWVRITNVSLTPPGWNRTKTDVAFQIADAFPGTPPYGIYVPVGLRFNGQMPQKYTEPSGTIPPFGGAWGLFSWSVADGNDWRPTASVEKGVNLLQWVRGFGQRFAEGA